VKPIAWRAREAWEAGGRAPLAPDLAGCLGAGVRGAVDPARCTEAALAAMNARADWTRDFAGEQFTLGRAFYTHLETDLSREYFAGAASADALVERHLPGFQDEMLDLFAALAGGAARRRHGFCGPGIHLFPPRRPVARRGGVIHADVEGLTPHQITRGTPALTLVVALRVPSRGGGLRLWEARSDEAEAFDEDEVGGAFADAAYQPGDALLFDSRRVHQILPFSGGYRVTATAHGVAVDTRLWECWF
jgi:hypothetical protein